MLFTLGQMNLAVPALRRMPLGNQPLPPAIRALIWPMASALVEGQAVQEMAGFAAVTAAGNYATNVGGASIDMVEVVALGDASDVSTPLLAGQTAGFEVRVRDTIGTEAVFATGLVSVAAPPSAWAYMPVEQGVQMTSWPAPGTAHITLLEVTENRALLGL